MQSADLTIRLPESFQLPVPDGLDPDGAVAREELLNWRVDGDAVRFLSLVVGDLERVREGAAELDAFRDAQFTPVDADTFYAYVVMDVRPAEEALFAALGAADLVVVPPVVYDDAETVRVTILGDPEELSVAFESLPPEVSVTVERVGDHSHLPGSLASRLTARQLEALTVAQERGYYEVPREAPLSAVASALDCSKSAASTLLREAERRLVAAAVGR